MTPGDAFEIGSSGLVTRRLGIGTWAWGDRRVWRFDPAKDRGDLTDAYEASRRAGITFFDTAEIYGRGLSEEILGSLARDDRDVIIATKYAPLPNRLRARSVVEALDRSLRRLGRERVDLYQVHWPYSVVPHAVLADGLAEAVRSGKARAIGVSNFDARAMGRMRDLLHARGVPLASNQVMYSLLARAPETNGVLEACRALRVTLIAYSPLALGALTGKYAPRRLPKSPWLRVRRVFRDLERATPLLETLRRVGEKHGATPSQVALAWLAAQEGVLPIPGARNARQATENAGALALALDADDLSEIDLRSRSWR